MLCCFWYIAQASLFSQLPLESVLLWVLWACWTKSVRHMCEGRGSSCKKEAGLPSKCPLLFHKFTRETHQQLWSRKKRQLQDRKRLLRMQAAKILGKVWQSLHEHIYLKILEEHQSFALIFQLVWTGRGSFCKKEAGWVQPCTCHHATLCLRITHASERMSKTFIAWQHILETKSAVMNIIVRRKKQLPRRNRCSGRQCLQNSIDLRKDSHS